MPAGSGTKKLGVIVNGTVEGDVHDIGKSIVSTMLRVLLVLKFMTWAGTFLQRILSRKQKKSMQI